jgi:guanylate kinase
MERQGVEADGWLHRGRPGNKAEGRITGQVAPDTLGRARDIVGSIADDPAPDAASSGHGCPESAGAASGCGLVFVISGPSGVGKDTIKQCLKDSGFPLGYCVTATTRPARANEVNGVHYYFVSDAEFDRMLADGELLEHAVNHGKRYGIPLRGLRDGMRTGRDVLVTPDVQGAAALRAIHPGVVSIFLAPSSLDELKPRLAGRKSETPEEMVIRLETAAREMERVHEFDYLVINERDRIDQTVDMVKAIVTAERSRVNPRKIRL